MAKTSTSTASIDAAIVTFLADHGLTPNTFIDLMAALKLVQECTAPAFTDTAAIVSVAPVAANAPAETDYAALLNTDCEGLFEDGAWYPGKLVSIRHAAKGHRYAMEWADGSGRSMVADVRAVGAAPVKAKRTRKAAAVEAAPAAEAPAPVTKAKAADPKADRAEMIRLAAGAVKAREEGFVNEARAKLTASQGKVAKAKRMTAEAFEAAVKAEAKVLAAEAKAATKGAPAVA